MKIDNIPLHKSQVYTTVIIFCIHNRETLPKVYFPSITIQLTPFIHFLTLFAHWNKITHVMGCDKATFRVPKTKIRREVCRKILALFPGSAQPGLWMNFWTLVSTSPNRTGFCQLCLLSCSHQFLKVAFASPTYSCTHPS